MEPKKPIKRNAAIVELSKDHHFALLLVWKVREGLKKNIEPSRMSQYAVHFFDNELREHFKAEEELLFCRLAKNDALRIRAEMEHTDLREMIESLRKNPDDKDLLIKFADSIDKHIRFEERELFNYLQEVIPDSTLSEIASSLSSREHRPDMAWADVFWGSKTPKV